MPAMDFCNTMEFPLATFMNSLLQCSVFISYNKQNNPILGCVIAVQTFGEFLNFNPHLHIIATDGCFCPDGSFMTVITPDASDLEAAFAVEVFDMLKKEGKIGRIIIDNMNSWNTAVSTYTAANLSVLGMMLELRGCPSISSVHPYPRNA